MIELRRAAAVFVVASCGAGRLLDGGAADGAADADDSRPRFAVPPAPGGSSGLLRCELVEVAENVAVVAIEREVLLAGDDRAPCPA
jgi:hypothetical protein